MESPTKLLHNGKTIYEIQKSLLFKKLPEHWELTGPILLTNQLPPHMMPGTKKALIMVLLWRSGKTILLMLYGNAKDIHILIPKSHL